jgi:transcriptional/translational regulatory protein YebC/TACO1
VYSTIFINVRLLKTIKKVIEESEDRYLNACDNGVPIKELEKLEENYRKSLKLLDMLETKDEQTKILKSRRL